MSLSVPVKYSEIDKKAVEMAQAAFVAAKPDERLSFPRYLEIAYETLLGEKK
jgi:hypothetical protein